MKKIILYASLLALLYVILSVRTLLLRRKLKIDLGDAGNKQMLKAMRAHANFSEYVPLSILLIYFNEVQNLNAYLIHSLGLSLLIGRLSHAYGVSQIKENFFFRVFGMAMTLSVLILSSCILLFCWLGQIF